MSIHSVLTTPRQAEQATTFSPRANARQGDDNSCWSTALKVAGVIAAIIASAAGFVFLGPIGGGIITLLAGGAALLVLFKNCCGTPAHDHAREVAVPWYQRVFSFLPVGGSPNAGPHVRVGGGHIPSAAAARPWYDNWFSFMPGGVRHMDGGRGGAHVPVGRGHGAGAPVHGHGVPPPGGHPPGPGGAHVPAGGGHMRGAPVPGAPGAAPHMPIGRGHVHGPGAHGGVPVPPPGGPGGPGAHVPVRRH
jgi:hypothetical protein